MTRFPVAHTFICLSFGSHILLIITSYRVSNFLKCMCRIILRIVFLKKNDGVTFNVEPALSRILRSFDAACDLFA